MKNSNSRHCAPRALLQATPVAASVAAMLLSTSYVQAQPAPAPGAGTQTITITGIRRGIESAINVKKNADAIVESISAEDIGKLPDSSIAESIARLPGVTAQRVNGRATEINIRGLSGDFANTLLNGREQVSTGNNRSVEFDQYPSELLSGVSIYKTPTADLLGQGLSGTIDLQTVRPLNFSQRVVGVSLRGEKNGGGTPFKGDGTRFSFNYIDQFADRTIGVAFGVARLSQKVAKSRGETYDTNNTGNFAGVNGGADFTFNQGFKYFVDNTDETRTGAMAVVEFKPNKDFSSVVDLFYSKFDKDVTKRGLEVQVNDSWKNGNSAVGYQAPTLTNATVTSGRLVSGRWGNVNPLSRTIWEPRKDDLQSVGWNNKLKFGSGWTGIADLSYSSAKSKEQIVEMEAGVFDTVNNRPLPGTVTISDYNRISGLQYDHGNPAIVRLTDPESWGQNGYDKIISTKDELKAVKLVAQKELEGFFSRMSLGVNLSTREKNKGSFENFLRLPARTGSTNPGTPLPAGAGSLLLPGLGFNTVSFDPGAAYPALYRLDPNVNGDILRKGWTVKEDVTTGFVKGDIDTEVFGMPVRGNVGAQLIGTKQEGTGSVVRNVGGAPTFVIETRGKSYTDFLPALNLSMALGSDQFLRAGLGRQMARPRMDQLSNFSRSEVNGSGRWTGESGNPLLDPYRATALDLSYEKYFGTKGYISVAAFYKDLKSYIFQVTDRRFNFTGLPNLSGNTPNSPIGEYTFTLNGKGGTIKGIELAVDVPLSLLFKPLDGFGIQASFSDTQSAIKPFGDADTRPLPGLSRKVQTLTAYYERSGFSVRVANRKRSSFIAEIEGFGSDREYKYARPETITDLQLGYEIQTGIAKGLNFLVQVNNLNNEPYVEYDASNNRDTKRDEYGRTVLFGVSYRF
ncbi:MAG: TonB-dependent receptor [Rubrivivax sp.]|nr:TonB-dependent receptor [Rubrivivax sp.]